MLINNLKRNYVVDFAVLGNYRLKISEKIDTYQDLAREQKRQWNMKVIEVGALEKRLGTGNQKRLYKPPQSWDQLKYLENDWSPEEICCLSDSSERLTTYSLWYSSRIIKCLKMYNISNKVINFNKSHWKLESRINSRREKPKKR